jgi:hypothetical protein
MQTYGETNFLFSFNNPFKIIILTLEILKQNCGKSHEHKHLMIEIYNKYETLAKNLIKNIADEKLLKNILEDKDLDGRKVLYVIYENELIALVQDPKIEDIIEM